MNRVFIGFLMLVTSLISCSKDDASDLVTVEGKWKYHKEGYRNSSGEHLFQYEGHCDTKTDYIRVYSNGNLEDVRHFPYECEAVIDYGIWDKENNTLYGSMGGLNAEIISVTASRLRIEYSGEDEQTIIQVFKR